MKLLSVSRSVVLVMVLVVTGIEAKESDPCDFIRPPVQADISLAEWLLREEKSFKQHGCWQRHLELGAQALEAIKGKGSNQQAVAMRLSLHMASSSFYLGDYEHSRKLANDAYQSAMKLNDRPGQVEGLYILSAIARTRKDRSAIDLAEQALQIVKQKDWHDRKLEAKVYFNLGAALSDVPPPELDRARESLQTAHRIFLDLQESYDALRAGLRWARVDYLMNQFEPARSLLSSLSPLVDGPRAEMLYGYQMAKVLHRQKQWDEALSYASKAKKIAKKLNAGRDLQRLDALIEVVNKRRFLDG